MPNNNQSASTAASLKEKYRKAGIDYTGLAEFSDISGYQGGTNDYTLKAHSERKVTCTGLKPNTRVWARFDGRNIEKYVRMQGNDKFGAKLVTNVHGQLVFFFKIPNDNDMKFKGFKHLLEVSDVAPPSNSGSISSGKLGSTTRCGQYYYAPSNSNGFDYDDVKQTSGISLSELKADGSKTILTNKDVLEEVPDFLSQTFVAEIGDQDGAYVKDILLYFKKKPADSDSSVFIQIRTVGQNGKPTDQVLGQSQIINAPDVTTSTAAQTETKFKLEDPIFLKNGRKYSLTVMPTEKKYDFELWTAQKNKPDSISNKKAFFPPNSTALFGSASGDQWAELKNERLKMVVQYMKFDKQTVSDFQLDNEKLEFLNISDISPTVITGDQGFQLDEVVRGESLLSIDYTSLSAPALGSVVQTHNARNGAEPGDSGYGHGTIRSIVNDDTSNDILTVKLDAVGTFASTANLYSSAFPSNGNGYAKIGITNSFTSNTVTGIINHVNTDFGRIRLTDSTGTPTLGFRSGEYIRGQSYGAVAKIDGVVNPSIDSVKINVPSNMVSSSDLKWYLKSTNNSGVTDPTWAQLTASGLVEFDKESKRIYSRSNKNNSTLLVKGIMTTLNENSSAIVDIDHVTVSAMRERISSNSANETFPAGEAAARYISQPIRTNDGRSVDPSERINVVTSAYFPQESEIKIFIRAKNDSDPEVITDKKYTEMTQYKAVPYPRSTLGDREDKVKLSFRVAANTDGENFLGVSDNALRENSSNNGVISYRSGDGSVHHGVDEYQLKVVFTRPDIRGTAHSPEISSLIITSHKVPLSIT